MGRRSFAGAGAIAFLTALACVAIAALWSAPAEGASRLALTASPASVEQGDRLSLRLLGSGRARCPVDLRAGGPNGRIVARVRVLRQGTLRIGRAMRPGDHVAVARCGDRAASARFIVHGRAGPDFSLTLRASGRPRISGGSRHRNIVVGATNLAPWAARSGRLCVRVSGARSRIAGVRAPGSLKLPRVACAILPRIASGRSGGFLLRVRTPRGVPATRPIQVVATITAANSIGRRQRWKIGARARPGAAAAIRLASQLSLRSASDRAPASASAAAPASRVAHQAPCSRPRKIGVAFVADDSGSMISNDPDNLRGQAIGVGLDQLPDGSLAGATRFADLSVEMFGVAEVTTASRPGLKAALGDLQSSGLTDYELALLGAQEQLALMGSADRRAVIFLSDGIPNTPDFTADRAIAAGGTPIFTIGFGSADQQVLLDIAARSGGATFTAGSADDLQSIFARIVARLSCSAPSLSTTVDLPPGQTASVPFTIAPDDGEFQALGAWSNGVVKVTARRPDGSVMTPAALRHGERFSENPTYALLSGANPQIGQWQLQLTAETGNVQDVRVTIDVFKKAVAIPPAPALVRRRDGRARDVCFEVYGAGAISSKDVFGGRETNFDHAASLYQVCAGFGTPEDFQWSLSTKCAFISAATVLAGGALAEPALRSFDALCSTAEVTTALAAGDYGGLATDAACEVFGSLFATAAGGIAAAATAPSGPGAVAAGVLVYRSFAAGSKLACSGLWTDAGRFGQRLQADHEANIARDIVSKGRCLRSRTRFGLISWSAATCS